MTGSKSCCLVEHRIVGRTLSPEAVGRLDLIQCIFRHRIGVRTPLQNEVAPMRRREERRQVASTFSSRIVRLTRIAPLTRLEAVPATLFFV